MIDVPDFLTAFYNSNEFVEEWLDSLDPSVKIFASNFCINVKSRYDCDYDKMMGTDEYEVAVLLSRFFEAFIKLKYQEENPNRVAIDFLIPE